MIAAAAGRICSGANLMYSQAEYLDQAKELRDIAEQVSDVRTHDHLIAAAEAYERMAGQELGPGPFSRSLIPNWNNRNQVH